VARRWKQDQDRCLLMVVKLGNVISIEDMAEFLASQKKRGSRLLKNLETSIPNIEVNFSTKLGQEILKDDLERYDILLSKVIAEEANEEDRAELRVLKRRFALLSARISVVMEGLKKMRG